MPEKRRILVRQSKEWGEILLGFESVNRYELFDAADRRIGWAAEEGGGLMRMFGRQLFGPMRKATVHVYGPDGDEIGRGEKPFRLWFQRMEVFAGDRKAGAIQRRFSIFHRKFTIENARGEPVFEILSPFFRIWTFKILFQGEEVGRISKQWGGILKEVFTDADVFGLEYLSIDELESMRPVLLGATFLIDFTCFENNQRRD